MIGWLRERAAITRTPASVPGASLAYVFGWVLVMLLVVQAITGAALAAFYSPSVTDAWASVAYIQDRSSVGWLIRGLHHHGSSALVIVSGLHLVQTALWGAYKRPRELVWWLGIGLLVLVLAFAVTGYVLRWDQAGFWANQVEVGIAAGTPVAGGAIKQLLIGGNDWGNLTLTRFYALHVVVLPGIVALLAVGHVVLARRHGATPRWNRADAPAVPRWPAQTFRDALAMAIAFAVLFGATVATGGVDLGQPADPTAPYDARPLWYFRWLFELRAMVPAAEQLIAMAAPAVVAGFLVALPLFDRGESRAPGKRLLWLGALAGLLAAIAALTILSLAGDAGDAGFQERRRKADQQASRLRAIAKAGGVPATGPHDLLETLPMYRARSLFAQRCAGCHELGSEDRKGPIIGPGHHSRAWLKGFLQAPSGEAYWGKTKLAATEDAMKPVELPAAELDDLVEALYAESGATDVDAARAARGRAIFERACTDCHSLEEGVAGGSGPGLAGLGSRDWFTSFIGNPKSPVHMGMDKSEMPRFDKDLSIVERDALAQYLVWLRTASPRDVELLGPL